MINKLISRLSRLRPRKPPVVTSRLYMSKTLSATGTPQAFPLEHNTLVRSMTLHAPDTCKGSTCPFHKRTDHSMRKFPQTFRWDRWIVERICPHGIGHPDPDGQYADTVHGCDGCCDTHK